MAERLKIEEKTIMEELMVIEEKSFLIGKPETYWATPFDRETGYTWKKRNYKNSCMENNGEWQKYWQ